MDADEARIILKDCAESRAQAAQRPMTIGEAIDEARWLESMHDGYLSGVRAKQTIITLHAALQSSPCFYKGMRENIPTFTLLAYDPAGHAAIRRWADLAQTHGARPEKYESALSMVRQWEQRPDLRWPT